MPRTIDIKELKNTIRTEKATLKELSKTAKVACREEDKQIKLVEKLEAKLSNAMAKMG